MKPLNTVTPQDRSVARNRTCALWTQFDYKKNNLNRRRLKRNPLSTFNMNFKKNFKYAAVINFIQKEFDTTSGQSHTDRKWWIFQGDVEIQVFFA